MLIAIVTLCSRYALISYPPPRTRTSRHSSMDMHGRFAAVEDVVAAYRDHVLRRRILEPSAASTKDDSAVLLVRGQHHDIPGHARHMTFLVLRIGSGSKFPPPRSSIVPRLPSMAKDVGQHRLELLGDLSRLRCTAQHSSVQYRESKRVNRR